MRRVITLNKRRLSDLLFADEIVITFLLFPFFKTSGFDFIPELSSLCNSLMRRMHNNYKNGYADRDTNLCAILLSCI